MADDQVNIRFGAQTEELLSGIKDVNTSLGSIKETADTLLSAIGPIGDALVAAFSVDKIVAMEIKFAELGEEIDRTSKIIGASIEEVQAFSYAAKIGGQDSGAAEMAIQRFGAILGDAAKGSGKAAEAYKNMGISVTDATGQVRPLMDVLGDVAQKFSETADGATKLEYARAIGSRGFAQLIPILDRGRDGLKDLEDQMNKTGAALSPALVKSLDENAEKMHAAQASWEAFEGKLADSSAAKNAISNLGGVASALSGMMDKLKEADTAWGHFMEKLGFVDDVTDLRRAVARAQGGDPKLNPKDYGFPFGPPMPDSKDLNQPELPALSGGKGGKGGKSNEDLQWQQEEIAYNLAYNKQILQQKKDELDAEVALGKISAEQKFQTLKDFANQEYDLDLAALQQEEQVHGISELQLQKLYDKEDLLAAKHETDLLNITRKSTAEQKKSYDQIFSSVNQAFDQMVAGIMQGTQSLAQVMVRLATDIGTKFTEELAIKPLVNWLKSESERLFIHQSTNSQILAADVANQAAAHAASVAANIGKISADAALTFAGVMANLAPVMGPAAAGPAAAAEATVLAQIPQASLAVGAWDLPHDMFAQLHAGEMVVPANFAQGLRENGSIGGSGGQEIHVHIHAIDTQTGTQFLKNNIGAIAQGIAQQVRNGNRDLKRAMAG